MSVQIPTVSPRPGTRSSLSNSGMSDWMSAILGSAQETLLLWISVSLGKAGKLAQFPFLSFCVGFLVLSVAFCSVLFLDA